MSKPGQIKTSLTINTQGLQGSPQNSSSGYDDLTSSTSGLPESYPPPVQFRRISSAPSVLYSPTVIPEALPINVNRP